MTAIKPAATRLVRGVASERYPSNKTCSMPECDRPADDQHHCWPRSAIGNDSWFIEITDGETVTVIPHVTGLCRHHHGDVEEHRAWIKLQEGEFLWFDRVTGEAAVCDSHWDLVGPLNPQPGSVEGKPKKRRKTAQPARKKAVYSIRVPKHEGENGYEVLDTLVDGAREKLAPELGQSENVPAYYVIVGALAQVLQS